jgi:signal transduction histidine kinase
MWQLQPSNPRQTGDAGGDSLAARVLQERVLFEQLLGDICSSLINVSPDELDCVLDADLQALVEFLGVDRSTLGEVGDDGSLRPTHSWARPGLPTAALLEPLDMLAYYLEQLRGRQMVIISRVNDLPPQAQQERQYCRSRGIKSHVGVPLIASGEFIGALGFAFLRQEHRWSDDMLVRLRLIGQAFAGALLRRRWMRQQLDLSRTLQRQVAHRTLVAERLALQLRRLIVQSAQAAQRERRRMAQAVHEGLAQTLTDIKLSLASQARVDLDAEPAQRLSSMLDEAIGVARSLTAEVCPQIVYHSDLAQSLHWLASHVRRLYRLNVSVKADEAAEPASLETREFLFEACHELLLNVKRHARTGAASVELTAQGDRAALSVADNGVGFETSRMEESPPEEFGLFDLRRRSELLGGIMMVASWPGHGTQVVVSVPMR